MIEFTREHEAELAWYFADHHSAIGDRSTFGAQLEAMRLASGGSDGARIRTKASVDSATWARRSARVVAGDEAVSEDEPAPSAKPTMGRDRGNDGFTPSDRALEAYAVTSRALMRLSEEVLEVPAPTVEQMRALAKRLCDGFQVETIYVDDCANFDAVTKRCQREARRIVMQEILAAKAADLIQKKDLKQSDFDSQRKYWKNQIEEIEVEIRSVSSEVRSKKTSREIICERRYDYTAGKVTEVRTDTEEILNQRDMTDQERQRELDFGNNDVDDAFGDAAE